MTDSERDAIMAKLQQSTADAKAMTPEQARAILVNEGHIKTDIPRDVIDRAAKAILRAEMSPHDDVDDEWVCYDDTHKAHYRTLAAAVISEAFEALEQRVTALESRTMGLMQFGTSEIMWDQIEKTRSSE